MKQSKSIGWFEPSAYCRRKALGALRALSARCNMLRVAVVVLTFAGVVALLLKRVLPDLEIEWTPFVIRAIGTAIVLPVLLFLLVLIPSHVSLSRRGIVIQWGQHIASYKYSEVSPVQVVQDGPWTLLRFCHRSKDVTIALGRRVRLDEVTDYLRSQGVETRT